jgi:uncharacterized membrane protein YraQ (UPF0718 family)
MLIFVDILNTFYDLLLKTAPWLAVSLIVTALSIEFLPTGNLNSLIRTRKGYAVPVAIIYAIFFPASPAYKVLIASFARRGGSRWAPVLTFVGVGAGAGIASILVAMVVGWQLALTRIVAAALFGFALSIIAAKYFEPSLASTAMDFEVETLITHDFVEIKEDNINKEEPPTYYDMWNSLVRVCRITVPWFILSIFLATLVKIIVPNSLTQSLLGGNLEIMLAALAGLPFYFLGGAEIPLIYVLIEKGLGLGGAVVLMLGAPLINAPVYVTVSRWIGYRMAAIYLVLCWVLLVMLGLAVNYGVNRI